MGINISTKITRHGFYPKGGGEVLVNIEPGKIENIVLLESEEIQKIAVTSIASNHLRQARVAERMLDGFSKVFAKVEASVQYIETIGPGCFVHSHVQFAKGRIGVDALGKIGKPAEQVGEEAARALQQAIDADASLDIWLVDQIIPYMALAQYHCQLPSRIKVPQLTRHAQTNLWLVKQFFDFDIGVEGSFLVC